MSFCQQWCADWKGEGLLQAVKEQNLKRIHYLLVEASNGQALKVEEIQEAFCLATKNDYFDIAKLLLEYGNFDIHFNNDQAIAEARPKCVRWLLELGLSPDVINLGNLDMFCHAVCLDTLKLLFPRYLESNPGNDDILYLMESAGDSNELEVIKYIYDQTNVRYERVECDEECCVMMEMLEFDYFECFQFLNELGHNKLCTSTVILDEALSFKRPKVATYIIENNTAIDLRYKDDLALKKALEKEYWDVIKSLIHRVTPACLFDNMAIKSAAAKGNGDMVKFLEEHGASLATK